MRAVCVRGCGPTSAATARRRVMAVRLSSLIVCATILAAVPSLAAEAPVGEWLVAERYANIRIESCRGALWGVVSGELKPGQDFENPDPALRSRPTLGIPILLDMRETESTRWGERTTRWEGHVYNSQNGKFYEGNIRLLSPNLMKIEGCEPGGIFCGGQQWTRVQVRAPSAGTTGPKGYPPPAAAGQRSNAPVAATPKSVIAAGDVCSRVVSAPRVGR
jgi:uncharacterized protein (DUF2147 family)